MSNKYIKIDNGRARIMSAGVPNENDTAFPYVACPPGKEQWLAMFEDDEMMPDGRPAPFFLLVACEPKSHILDVAGDAIRQVRDNGFDINNVKKYILYKLPDGNPHDVSHIQFFV